MFQRLFNHLNYESIEESNSQSIHYLEQYTSDEYVYVKNRDGQHGFIINREKARLILSKIEQKFGADKLHNPLNYDSVYRILHKRCDLEISYKEWKAMGDNKPKVAKW